MAKLFPIDPTERCSPRLGLAGFDILGLARSSALEGVWKGDVGEPRACVHVLEHVMGHAEW